MLKSLSLSRRFFLSMVAVDLLFEVVFYKAYCLMLDADPLRSAGILALATLVRVGLYWLLVEWTIAPTDLVHLRAAKGRKPQPEDLRRADALLQTASLRTAIFAAILWGAQVPVTTVLLLPSGGIGLQGAAWWVTMIMAAMLIVGAFTVFYTLGLSMLAAGSGDHARVARSLGIVLERSPQLIGRRITLLSLCLCLGPSFLVSSFLASYAGRATTEAARADASSMASTLLFQRAGSESPLGKFDPAAHTVDAAAFVQDASGQLLSTGAPLPGWLNADWVAHARLGAVSIPEYGHFVRVDSLPEGGRIGAVTRAGALDLSRFSPVAVMVVLLVIWGPLCGILMARVVSSPLNLAADAAQRIVDEGDLSSIKSLPVSQEDETGRVLSTLNNLLDMMRELARAATAVGEGNIQVQIAGKGELPDAFRRMVDSLRQMVAELQGTSTELGSAAAEIFAASQEQEAAATSHSSGMVEITQTMDSLSRSSVHVAESVQGVLQNAERTLENTDQMVARISALSAQANRIGDILEVIRDIADRSDLLALNGSLEATRAGEAGRGFSLVAGEMRRLAERVTASVNDIKKLVTEIRESGASTVVATEESKKLAQRTTEAARNITLVTQQQRSSTEQVSQSVKGVAEVVAQAATATMQTRSSAQALKAHADRLTELVQRFQASA